VDNRTTHTVENIESTTLRTASLDIIYQQPSRIFQSLIVRIWLIIALLYALTLRALANEPSDIDEVAKHRLDTIGAMMGQARIFAGTPDSTLLQSIQTHITQLRDLDSTATEEYLTRSVELVRSTPNPILRMHLLQELARVALARKSYILSATIAQEALDIASQSGVMDKRDAEITQLLRENQTKTFAVISLIVTIAIASAGLFAYYVRDRVRSRTEYTLRSMNADLVNMNHLLHESNQEVLRQQEVLAEQSRNIEIANSELQEKNLEMQSINAHLQALHEEKNEFLGIAAHDLRNPLTSISLSAERGEVFLQNFEKHQHKFPSILHSIQAESQRMLNIINSLLDVHRIETLGLQVKPAELDAVTIMGNIAQAFENRAEEKNILIATRIPASTIPLSAMNFYCKKYWIILCPTR
jgi:signal transduction histidine kinase